MINFLKTKKEVKGWGILLILAFCSISFSIFAQPPAGGSVRMPEAKTNGTLVGSQPAAAQPEGQTAQPAVSAQGEELVYLNVIDQDIKDIIYQISKATSRNFIIDEKVRGKVTIISEKMMTREEAYQAFLSALEVAGFTTVTGPGGIIKVVSKRDAVSSPVPIHIDSTPYTDSFVTRLVKLENISALEMSQAIKGMVSKDGNMFAYPATNTLIITDSGTNIDRLMKIIKELDQEGPQEVVEIIPIKNADAKTVAQTVLGLFETKAGAAGGKRAVGEEVEEVSKIIADDRTNSIIVVANKRALAKVHEIIGRLDRSVTEGGGLVHVHYLKYANATKLATTLSAATAKGSVPKDVKGAAPPVAQFEGGVSIGADESTNSLIITASPKDYKLLVEELLSKLDIPRRQVYLESMVMEISLSKGAKYGATGYAGVGKGQVLGFGGVGYPPGFSALSGLFQPSSFFASQGLLGGLLGRDNVTITVPNSSGGTTNLTIPSFSAFLNLIQVYAETDLVSAPNILTMDNEDAEIAVIKKKYAKTQSFSATGTTIAVTPTPLEAGLTLKINPQITEGDMVRLKIAHEQSNFEGDPDPSTGATPSTHRKINTTVVAQDGQTVVLGGLMQDLHTRAKQKVPILGDIPILGLLFQNTAATKDKSNLLVFITPHVVRDPSGFADIMQRKIEQRNKFLEENYGKRRQKEIKKMIAGHREDLLKYSPPQKIESDKPAVPIGK